MISLSKLKELNEMMPHHAVCMIKWLDDLQVVTHICGPKTPMICSFSCEYNLAEVNDFLIAAIYESSVSTNLMGAVLRFVS